MHASEAARSAPPASTPRVDEPRMAVPKRPSGAWSCLNASRSSSCVASGLRSNAGVIGRPSTSLEGGSPSSARSVGTMSTWSVKASSVPPRMPGPTMASQMFVMSA